MATGAQKPVMSLKQFIMRQEVLKLYRNIFRCIREVPDENDRKDLREWARHDFKANKHHTDEHAIKMLLLYGQRALKEFRQSLDLSR